MERFIYFKWLFSVESNNKPQISICIHKNLQFIEQIYFFSRHVHIIRRQFQICVKTQAHSRKWTIVTQIDSMLHSKSYTVAYIDQNVARCISILVMVIAWECYSKRQIWHKQCAQKRNTEEQTCWISRKQKRWSKGCEDRER